MREGDYFCEKKCGMDCHIASRIFARKWNKHLMPWLCMIPGLQRKIVTSWVDDSYPKAMVAQATTLFPERILSCTWSMSSLSLIPSQAPSNAMEPDRVF